MALFFLKKKLQRDFMNEIARRESSDELITTKQLAEQLGTRPNVITENAKKCLPNKKIENGKATYWTQAEVTVLIEQLKCNQVNGRTFPNLSVELKGVERCERDSAITTMQFAKQLGTTPNVVLENARKCLPNKRIENGKPTFWTKEEVTVVLDYMKAHTSNNRSVELNSTVANISTDLSPALKLKKALELAQEAYEEELAILKAKNKNLESENGNLKIELDESKEWSTIQKWCNENGFSFNRKELAKISLRMGRMGFERRKIYSVEYQNGLWSYRKSDIEDFFEKELEKGLA